MEQNDPNLPPWRVLPWATLIAVAVAVFVFFSPAAIRALEYDRLRVVDGEWWRLFTGNWVHFNRRDMFWNLAVLLVAGSWAERVMPIRARVLYVVGPALVGLAVYLFEPQLGRYAGISGLSAGMVTFLAIAQLRIGQTDRWFWRAVLALVVLKVAAEAIVASRWFAHYPDPAVRAVPLSHLSGVAAAVIVLGVRRRDRS